MATAKAQMQGATSFDVDGIKVIFKPTVKDVINVRVLFRGGVSNYSSKQAGIEKFALASVVQCGTAKYPGNAFKDTADYYGIDIGSAATYDYSNIDMDCISKYFDKAWDLLADAVTRPTFEPAQVELLRTKLINTAKQSETNAESHTVDLLEKNAFAGTVYETSPAGTEETLAAFKPSELSAYYKTILNKGQLFIVVAGKLTKEEIIAKVHASFVSIPAKDYTQPTLHEPVWDDYKVLAEKRQLSINYVAAIMNAPPVYSEDYIPYRLGMSILASILFSDLRIRLHLSYDPGAETEMRQMPYGFMFVSTSEPEKAVNEMENELLMLKTHTITPAALKHLINSYILTYYLQQESTAAITGTLGMAEVLDAWNTQDQLPEKLNKVTVDQINQVLNQYIKGLRWSYLGDMDAEHKMETDDAFRTNLKQDK
jgi:predicted Zn-dependent peptidase